MADDSANELIDLMDQVARRQSARDLDGLNQLIDAGDRIVAQHIVASAARAEAVAGVDPTEPPDGGTA